MPINLPTLLSACALLAITPLATTSFANEPSTSTSSLKLAQSLPPRFSRPPAGRGSSGATRGECALENNSELASADNDLYYVFPYSPAENYSGSTESVTPQIWVYVPYVLDERSLIKFEIERVDTGEFVSVSSGMTANATGGFLGLTAPVDLEPGVTYAWNLKVRCDSTDTRQKAQSIRGRVSVVSPGDLPLSERWYDHLNAVMSAYQLNPEAADVQADWAEMIETTGLVDFPHTSNQTTLTF